MTERGRGACQNGNGGSSLACSSSAPMLLGSDIRVDTTLIPTCQACFTKLARERKAIFCIRKMLGGKFSGQDRNVFGGDYHFPDYLRSPRMKTVCSGGVVFLITPSCAAISLRRTASPTLLPLMATVTGASSSD
eukprot:765878-Hanusia_phi.AAC.9